MKASIAILSASAIAFLCGCSSKPVVVDEQQSGQIMRDLGFDTQDAVEAATQLSQSLLNSGTLGRDGEPSVIVISNYVNNTGEQIDRDTVVKRIRVALNKAGVAQTLTSIGVGGGAEGAEDGFSARERSANILSGDDEPLVEPDFALTFKILKDHVSQGSKKQVTYTFQMSLTEIRTGLAAWEEEKRVITQGGGSVLGW